MIGAIHQSPSPESIHNRLHGFVPVTVTVAARPAATVLFMKDAPLAGVVLDTVGGVRTVGAADAVS